MIDMIMGPWPWYVAGPLIAFIVYLQLYFGKKLGVSSNFKTMCSAIGASRISDYFKIDFKSKSWGILFIIGIVIGGYVASNYLSYNHKVKLNPKTVNILEDMGFEKVGEEYVPFEIYDLKGGKNTKGILILFVGGLLVGFGARYANGCTSGHAISGTANLQIPSFIALIGYFSGGLIMVHFLFPYIFK